MSDGGVGSLVQLLTQDLQLGKALDKDGDIEDTGLISQRQARFTADNFLYNADQTPV